MNQPVPSDIDAGDTSGLMAGGMGRYGRGHHDSGELACDAEPPTRGAHSHLHRPQLGERSRSRVSINRADLGFSLRI
jgi:hypothetical protein